MEEVSGPVIAIGLVLTAVFVPCAFITGIIGQFFRQFALTIATSTIISAFNSLTLSPALAGPAAAAAVRGVGERGRCRGPRFAADRRLARAGQYLRHLARPHAGVELARRILGCRSRRPCSAGALAGWLLEPAAELRRWAGSSALFNAGFRRRRTCYTRVVGVLLRVSVLVLLVYGGLLGLTYWGFTQHPAGFIPSQDKGYLLVNVQLPDSTSVEHTQEVMGRIEAIARRCRASSHTVAIRASRSCSTPTPRTSARCT